MKAHRINQDLEVVGEVTSTKRIRALGAIVSPQWQPGFEYLVNDMVEFDNVLWTATEDHLSVDWDPTKWEALGSGAASEPDEFWLQGNVIGDTIIALDGGALSLGAGDGIEFTGSDEGDLLHISGNPFVGSTATEEGQAGMVPQPPAGSNDFYLRGDGQWTPATSGITGITLEMPVGVEEVVPGPSGRVIISNGGNVKASGVGAPDTFGFYLDETWLEGWLSENGYSGSSGDSLDSFGVINGADSPLAGFGQLRFTPWTWDGATLPTDIVAQDTSGYKLSQNGVLVDISGINNFANPGNKLVPTRVLYVNPSGLGSVVPVKSTLNFQGDPQPGWPANWEVNGSYSPTDYVPSNPESTHLLMSFVPPGNGVNAKVTISDFGGATGASGPTGNTFGVSNLDNSAIVGSGSLSFIPWASENYGTPDHVYAQDLNGRKLSEGGITTYAQSPQGTGSLKQHAVLYVNPAGIGSPIPLYTNNPDGSQYPGWPTWALVNGEYAPTSYEPSSPDSTHLLITFAPGDDTMGEMGKVTITDFGGPTTAEPFIGASSSESGQAGVVAMPMAGDQEKFLKGDGTWADVPVPSGGSSVKLEFNQMSLSPAPNGMTHNIDLGDIVERNVVEMPVNGLIKWNYTGSPDGVGGARLTLYGSYWKDINVRMQGLQPGIQTLFYLNSQQISAENTTECSFRPSTGETRVDMIWSYNSAHPTLKSQLYIYTM